jgi:hypothetical protein
MRRTTLIDFIGEIKPTMPARKLENVRDSVNIKLSDATAIELSKRTIEYDMSFTLLPGEHTIKFLARDAGTGRRRIKPHLSFPRNLNRGQRRIPIGSVVLSSWRTALSKGCSL